LLEVLMELPINSAPNQIFNHPLHQDKKHFLRHPMNVHEWWLHLSGIERLIDNGQTWRDPNYNLDAGMLIHDD